MTERPVLDDVTLVIPTIGRQRLLRGCLEAIVDGDSWPAVLTVVDQSSSEAIAAMVGELRRAGMDARHLALDRTGIAVGMNRGMETVNTPLTVVTHDDCRAEPGWLRRVTDAVRACDASVVVTGRVVPEPGHDVPSTITSTSAAVHSRPRLDRDVLFPANMAFPTEVWGAVGQMDEDPLLSRASEDNEWAYRVLRAGIPIAYVPEAVVCHVAWRDRDALDEVEWSYARSQGAFYGKYIRRGDSHIAARAVLDASRGLWRWIRGTVNRNSQLARRGGAGSLGLLEGLLAGIRRGGPVVTPADGDRSATHEDVQGAGGAE